MKGKRDQTEFTIRQKKTTFRIYYNTVKSYKSLSNYCFCHSFLFRFALFFLTLTVCNVWSVVQLAGCSALFPSELLEVLVGCQRGGRAFEIAFLKVSPTAGDGRKTSEEEKASE